MAAGKIDREIGALLGCSRRTAHKHLQRVYVKLAAETRTAAVMCWLGTDGAPFGGSLWSDTARQRRPTVGVSDRALQFATTEANA